MEHAPVSHVQQLPVQIGSSIIVHDVDGAAVGMQSTEIAATLNIVSGGVGKSIAHHFVDEFRRYKWARISTASAASHTHRAATTLPPQPTTASIADVDVKTPCPPPATVSGFRATLHCCRICKTLLRATSFYPSNLRRSTFYCKTCCNSKKQAGKRRARLNSNESAGSTATATVSAVAPASSLSPVSGTAAEAITPLPSLAGTAAMDDRTRGATRAAERHNLPPAAAGSAPGPSDHALNMMNRLRRMCARPSECGFRMVLPSPVSLDFDVKVARQLLLWWNTTSALSPTTDRQDDQELRFLPWLFEPREDPTQPLQPWEVIPVTRVQSRRLTSTPTHLWAELLEPSAVAHVVAKIAELRRVIVAHEISPPTTSIDREPPPTSESDSDGSAAMCLD